jgi:glucose-1-phosphate thymidylyltransferase
MAVIGPVGVIPAAGRAERLQPLPCSKEVYPVGGRPVMDYVVERLRAARCRVIRVVTRPDKKDVIEHAERLGAEIVAGAPETLAASIALGLRGLPAADVVLVGLPDTLWEPIDGFMRLLRELDDATEIALGVFESDEPERSDVVVLADDGSVRSVHVKEAGPPGNLVWGCFAARVGALAGLGDSPEPGHYFAGLADAGTVRAVRLPGRMIDIGTPEALAALGGHR